MLKTKKLNTSKKQNTSKKLNNSKKANNFYFGKLANQSTVVKNMLNDMNNIRDFKGFIINDLSAKYFKDLIPKRKKEVYLILIEYLKTNTVKSIAEINSDTIIGIISVAKLLEMKKLFKNMVISFVKSINKSKLRKRQQDDFLKLLDLVHPDDLIVKDAFKKESYYDASIFNLFDEFVHYSIKMDINHLLLEKLFKFGFNVKTDYDTKKEIKLHRAEELKTTIEKGSFRLFKILVEKGNRDTHVDFNNCHILNWSVYYDRLDIVKYLIEKEKHNINSYCNNSYSFPPKPEDASPLYNAVLRENYRIVKYLLSKKADVNSDANGQDEETPAFAAVKLNNLKILKILVKAGANLDTQTPDGRIAYDIAVESKNQEMVDYLKKNGARIEIKNDEIRPDFDPNF